MLSLKTKWKTPVSVTAALVVFALAAWPQTRSTPRPRSANVDGGAMKAGWLGIGMLDMGSGVIVTNVMEGSPAAKAGIHQNDIVTEIDGAKIEDLQQVRVIIAAKGPGAKINLTLMRNSTKVSAIATLGTQAETIFGGPMGIPQELLGPGDVFILPAPAPLIGIEGEPLTPQLAAFFGVKEGVLVRTVNANTPAEKAGLKAGDVITKVNGFAVASPREITGIVRSAHKIAVFTVVRAKKEIKLQVEIAELLSQPLGFNPRRFHSQAA